MSLRMQQAARKALDRYRRQIITGQEMLWQTLDRLALADVSAGDVLEVLIDHVCASGQTADVVHKLHRQFESKLSDQSERALELIRLADDGCPIHPKEA